MELSDPETRLMRALNAEWLLKAVENGQIMAPRAWEILGLETFIAGKTGPEVEALRRVCAVLKSCSIYRHTPEFDALCAF